MRRHEMHGLSADFAREIEEGFRAHLALEGAERFETGGVFFGPEFGGAHAR